MFAKVLLFCLFIVVGVLFQISWFAFPFALVAILVWYQLYRFKNIEFLVVFFAFLLSSLANLSLALVLIVSSLSLAIFVLLRKYFPERSGVILLLGVSTLIFWNISLVFFASIFAKVY